MKFLIFGDSITQGFYDDEKGGWPNRLFAYLNKLSIDTHKEGSYSVYNLGVDGNTVKDVLDRYESEVSIRRGKDNPIIILDIGGNDSARNLTSDENVCPLSDFSKQYTQLIEKAKKDGAVVCLGFHDSNESLLNPASFWENHAVLDVDVKRYNKEIKRLANEMDVFYIDMTGVLSANLSDNLHDGLHPSAKGHQLIAEKIISEFIDKKLF